MSTELEESFGGVVVRDGNVLVITPAGRPQISTLPKGGPQEGESPWVTAAREVREETGVEARIVERLGDVRYRYRRGGVRVFKTVGFYLCDYVSGDTADHDHEVEEAREEGVTFHWLAAPVRFVGEHRLIGVECSLMQLGPPDESGRRRPTIVPGSEFVLPAETAIVAIGQQPRREPLP